MPKLFITNSALNADLIICKTDKHSDPDHWLDSSRKGVF